MKKYALFGIAFFIITGSSVIFPIFGADISLQPESKLWLMGDSTLHAYSSTASAFEVKLETKVETNTLKSTLYEDIANNRMTSLEVVVPVENLKSGKNQLDKNMGKSLKSADHPNIIFHLVSYTVLNSTGNTGMPIVAKGDLSVAGETKSVDIEAMVLDGNPTRIQGKKELLMTDYGVKPPSFFGAIKTRNEVVINFDLVLNKNQ